MNFSFSLNSIRAVGAAMAARSSRNADAKVPDTRSAHLRAGASQPDALLASALLK